MNLPWFIMVDINNLSTYACNHSDVVLVHMVGSHGDDKS